MPTPDFAENTRSEDRTLVQAVLRRWPIPPEFRDAIIKRLMTIACDPGAKPRDATRAAQAVIAAEKQNQEDEPGKAPLVHVSFAIDQAIERELARLAGPSEDQILEAAGEIAGTESRPGERHEEGEAVPNDTDAAPGGIPGANGG